MLDIAHDSSQLLLMEFQFSQLDNPLWLQPLPAGTPRKMESTGHDAHMVT